MAQKAFEQASFVLADLSNKEKRRDEMSKELAKTYDPKGLEELAIAIVAENEENA